MNFKKYFQYLLTDDIFRNGMTSNGLDNQQLAVQLFL